METNQKQKNIPEDWKMVDLGDLGKVSMCKRILKDQTLPTGDIPFFKIGTFGKEPDAYISYDIYNEFKEKYSFPKVGDILISASGTIGRTVVYDGAPAYFQDSNIIWIANNESVVSNPYLNYLYKKVRWSTASGTIARLYNDNVRSVSIVAPPLPEQNRIVAILETWDSGIEKLKQKITIKKEIKKGLMQELLTGKKRLPGFSGEWKIKKLNELVSISTGKKDVNEGNPRGQYPFFTCAREHTYSDNFSYDIEAILIAGNADVGHCKYYKGKFEAYQRTYILSDFSQHTDSIYMFLYMSFFFKNYVESLKQIGAMSYIKLPMLKDFQIKVASLEEQKAIAKILTAADEEIIRLEKKLTLWQDQKKYLLNNLVTGQIRTPENLLEINHK